MRGHTSYGLCADAMRISRGGIQKLQRILLSQFRSTLEATFASHVGEFLGTLTAQEFLSAAKAAHKSA